MEPPEAKIVHVIYTMVKDIKENKDGFEWVNFDGSHESLELPAGAYRIGGKVKITLERID